MKALQRILYVEDEPDIQEIARLSLEMLGGFTLSICSSGAEALSMVEKFAPDMILLDVMMPDMDGPTTLKALRALPGVRDIPVAFMTAKVMPSEIAQFKALGAVDVISKPFNPVELPQRVRAVWETAT